MAWKVHRCHASFTRCPDVAVQLIADHKGEPSITGPCQRMRPGMAQFPNAMLLCASSPYARKGALHDAYKRHYGKDGDPALVWKAPTRVMNPTINQSVVDAAMARDRLDALAEWMAEFRSDLESFISREAVLACGEAGVFERPPMPGLKYMAFCDPSGGSSDSMTLAIAHEVDGRVTVDCLREVPAPFDPESCVDEFVQLLSLYGVRETNGDRYAAAWVATAFEKRGVSYRHCELPRSALYLNLLPHLNSRTVRLLDHPRAINQISSLERRTARGARDTIDHPRGQHDDAANAVASVVFVLAQRPKQGEWYIGTGWGGKPRRIDDDGGDAWGCGNSSPPCLTPLSEPAPETVERWARHAEFLRSAAAADAQRRNQFAVDPRTGQSTR